jgi:hypothetical protein
MLHASHPIRWAWDTWERRRRETAERLAMPEYATLEVLRLRHPAEAERRLRELVAGEKQALLF